MVEIPRERVYRKENSVARFRIWATIMMLICCAAGVLVYGGARYSFGIFMKPMAESMGWSRTEVSMAVTINLLSYAFIAPIVGLLIDKIGVRKVFIAGALLLAFSLCGMYLVENLWLFYLLYGFLAAFGSSAAGRMNQATIVAYWFVRRRGLMMGITSISIGLGTAIMAPVVQVFLDAFDWRSAFVAIGFLVVVLLLLPVTLFVTGSGRPEDKGLRPDGVSFAHSDQDGEVISKIASIDYGWTLGEVLRHKTFWGVSIAMALCFTADYIVLIHVPAHIRDQGHSGAVAAFILSIATSASCVGRIGFGWLADYVSLRYILCLLVSLQLVAMPLMIMGSANIHLLYIFAVCWGIGYGGAGTYLPMAIVSYFGKLNFGSIYGSVTLVVTLCASSGGLLGGLIYDSFNSYELAWYACTAMWALALLIAFIFARAPSSRVSVTE